MPIQTIPNCISIIHTCSQKLDHVVETLRPGSSEYVSLKKILSQSQNLLEVDEFVNNPALVTYLQTLLLLGISFYGGAFIPFITNFEFDNDKVRILWDSNVNDSWTFGVIDDGFIGFWKYYQAKVFSDQPFEKVPATVFHRLFNVFETYKAVIVDTFKWIDCLTQEKSKALEFLKEEIDNSVLFMVLSCLAPEQINSIFLSIQQYVPTHMTINNQRGNQVNVSRLFQTPTTDINYLLEKIQIFHQIYFSSANPQLRGAIQERTKEAMLGHLTNDQIFNQFSKVLKDLKDYQIQPRVRLYEVVNKHLYPLF